MAIWRKGRDRRHAKTRARTSCALAFILWSVANGVAQPNQDPPAATPRVGPLDLSFFLRPFLDQPELADANFDILEANWNDSYVVMLLELSQFVQPGLRLQIFDFLAEMTGENLGPDLEVPFRNGPGYQWVWRHKPAHHPDYPDFKAGLYARIEPRLGRFFGNGRPASIWLDEVRWTTTERDDLPALVNPATLSVAEARQLPGSAPVLGLVYRGTARAYPKSILAAHELVKDSLAGEEFVGVYSPIDGTAVFYRPFENGRQHDLKASGFFYRANKLLYDEATKSLWSSLAGSPVVGTLSGRGIELEKFPFVVTTWGEWKRRHPETTVVAPLALTNRVVTPAPRAVLATERLLFPIPKLDNRLKNKAEVLGLRWTNAPQQRLALSSDFLRRQHCYSDRLGNIPFVILTDRSGAHRVYESTGHIFTRWNGDRTVTARDGKVWVVSEDDLRREGQILQRLPAQTAYWYAWAAGYPDTRLVK